MGYRLERKARCGVSPLLARWRLDCVQDTESQHDRRQEGGTKTPDMVRARLWYNKKGGE